MQPPHQHSQINLAEIKAQISKKLGPERFKQYFYYLNRFLSLKVSKVEFDKLCLRTIGRKNITLHNQFIRSILRNSCSKKGSPPAKDDVLKHDTQVGGKEITADGSHTSMTQASGSPGLSNGGDMLPVTPRRARTDYWRPGERCSALGPNGKTSFALQLSTSTQSSELNVKFENGGLNPSHLGRPVHHHQEIMLREENECEIFVPNPAKISVVRRSSDVSSPVYSNDHIEMVVRDDGKQVPTRTSLQAPLGVPLCPVSIGGACKALPPASSSRCIGTFSDGALLDSLTLRERMEQIAVAQGLEGLSADCANILNHGLDSYMRRLIMSCIELVGSRLGYELTRNSTHKLHTHMKLISGIRPGHQYQILSSRKPLDVQEQGTNCPISLHDFRVAMELNPRQLGEDWPLLLEKICMHAFEE